MASLVNAITKFQNVALITTAGAVAFWYVQNDPEKHSSLENSSHSSDAQEDSILASRKGHTLTGEVVDRDKQVP